MRFSLSRSLVRCSRASSDFSASSSSGSISDMSRNRVDCRRASISASRSTTRGVITNILCTVSRRVEEPPKSQPMNGMSRNHGIPHPAFSSMSRRYPASNIDSSSNIAVCVKRRDVRVMGMESTLMDSKPPSSRSIVSHTWFGTFVAGDVIMRGLMVSRVPAVTSSSDATSVPTTRAW